MKKHYTSEVNAQILISLLKQHGIKRIIASPGTTNMAFVASVQQDSWFEVFSSVDERSAAYIACGMAAESGEPVVISCTGATASRNYLSGMTEAYYRKLPVLAVTSSSGLMKVGHHIAQVIDRSSIQNDVAKLSVTLRNVKDEDDKWDCEINANRAILELKRHGGGSVHINLETRYSSDYSLNVLSKCRMINRITSSDQMPQITASKVAVFVGSHRSFTEEETIAMDEFCEKYNGVVFCDHTSGYQGKFRLQISILAAQSHRDFQALQPNLVIHIGEVSGDYYIPKLVKCDVWRVSEDGEIRDTFRKLKYIFEMNSLAFFSHYNDVAAFSKNAYFGELNEACLAIRNKIPEIPFSNIWTAGQLSPLVPSNTSLHFAILNSLRAWNFFEVDPSVKTTSNVGGFGIDGGVSAFFGAALLDPSRLCFLVIGDLAFFYDMNVLGNRHLSANMRILLINNGRGVEFKQHGHVAESFGDATDAYISAAGHFGNKSPDLVKNYAENLGFEYLTASDKESFEAVYAKFVAPEIGESPMLFEVFTDSETESKALELMMNIETDNNTKLRESGKRAAKSILGSKGIDLIKKLKNR